MAREFFGWVFVSEGLHEGSGLFGEFDVEVVVEQKASRWNPWRITQSSGPFTKKDAETFTFTLNVPSDGEVVFTYTIRTGE